MAGAFAVLFFIGLVILFFLSGIGNEPKVAPSTTAEVAACDHVSLDNLLTSLTPLTAP